MANDHRQNGYSISVCGLVRGRLPGLSLKSLRESKGNKTITLLIREISMLNEERRREILELLRNDGRVLVRDLAKRFRISLITIRKDLEYLHHQGMLERTQGGALPLRTGALQDQTLREKERLHRQEKMRIAAAALRMIRPGQVIILDSGT